MKNLFKSKQYDYRIIIEAIGLYYHFGLSFRQCEAIMRKFSIPIDLPRFIGGTNNMEKSSTTSGKNGTEKEDYPNLGASTRPM
jgi:Transposase and inactivated derivatives